MISTMLNYSEFRGLGEEENKLRIQEKYLSLKGKYSGGLKLDEIHPV